MRIAIAWKDIQIFLKERGQLVMLFLLPLVFILAFSAVYSALGDEVELIKLAVVNLDPDGEMSQALLEDWHSAAPSRSSSIRRRRPRPCWRTKRSSEFSPSPPASRRT